MWTLKVRPTMAGLLSRWRSRDDALVPADTAASRALVAVVALLSFLASLAAGGAALTVDRTRGWRGDLASEATVQVRPIAGRSLDEDVRRAAELARRDPAVVTAEPIPDSETARLLEPWLGGGLDLADLPVPRLVILKLAPGSRLDAAAFRARLQEALPGASLDDHRAWTARLTNFGASVVALAFAIMVLVLAAAAAAVAFATGGAMADNREVVDVLRLVGAYDRYVASVFQSRFWRLGMKGGLIGAGAACVFFVVGSAMVSRFVTGDAEALLGRAGLGWLGYVLIATVPLVVSTIASIVSRRTVLRYLSVS